MQSVHVAIDHGAVANAARKSQTRMATLAHFRVRGSGKTAGIARTIDDPEKSDRDASSADLATEFYVLNTVKASRNEIVYKLS